MSAYVSCIFVGTRQGEFLPCPFSGREQGTRSEGDVNLHVETSMNQSEILDGLEVFGARFLPGCIACGSGRGSGSGTFERGRVSESEGSVPGEGAFLYLFQ